MSHLDAKVKLGCRLFFLFIDIALIVGVLFLYPFQVKAKEDRHIPPEPLKINKIYLCIHPYCWSVRGRMVSKGAEYNAILAWELWTHMLHMDLVSNMKPDEAIVIIPSESSLPMRRLQQHAEKTLGRRCIVLERTDINFNWLRNVPDGIRRFSSGEEINGKQQWIRYMLTNSDYQDGTKNIATEIEEEIRQICEKVGYDWDVAAIELMCFARLLAQDVTLAFRRRGLVFDSKTVEGVSFGEGFERCAMDIKSMLPYYLGLVKPIEADFELSVSGAPFLINAKFREQIVLTDNVRLFLWEGEDGWPIALFYNAKAYPSDPRLYVHLPTEYNYSDGDRSGKDNSDMVKETMPDGSYKIPEDFYDCRHDSKYIVPDGWVLGGQGMSTATIERDTDAKIGAYSVKLTRKGANCAIAQNVRSGKGMDYWRGKTVTFSCWVKCDIAGRANIYICDGVRNYEANSNSGTEDWELLTVTHAIDADATMVQALCFVVLEDTSASFDSAMLVEGSAPPGTNFKNVLFNGNFEHWREPGTYQARYIREYSADGELIETKEYYSDGSLAGKIETGRLHSPYYDMKTIYDDSEDFELEIRTVTNEKVAYKSKNGYVSIAVYTATRRVITEATRRAITEGELDRPYYLIAKGISLEDFRSMLVKVKIESKE